MTQLRFVDLFAGLGGFHVAMARLGHRCVMAVEKNCDLQNLYKKNFGISPEGDIREIPLSSIPEHDILCAGFPCQPFSKAGPQTGFACEKNGDLANILIRWARTARPSYILLENVANFSRHDGGKTWRWFSQELRHAGYTLDAKVISPHEHGVPQIRERLFIAGSRNGLSNFSWPEPTGKKTSVRTVLEDNPDPSTALSPRVLEALDTWDEFLRRYPQNRRKPWFPLWAAEFGATYPFTTTSPLAIPSEALRQFRGAFGCDLREMSEEKLVESLPPYARVKRAMPSWKVRFLELNRNLYEENSKWIDPWLPRLLDFEHSFQKFEWNFDGNARSIWDTVIQLRGSGIRAKSPDTTPALIATSSSQVPIIGWEKRYMTVRERARLQDLGDLPHLPAGQGAATQALGNAVNVKVVELIGQALFGRSVSRKFAA